MEKTEPGNEDEEDLYLLFVDFSKAFETVSRLVLWYLLEHKYFVPEGPMALLRKLHTDTKATVTYKGKLDVQRMSVDVGVMQGAVTAAILWNISELGDDDLEK